MWKSSLAYCRNFQILSHGGIRRRSGTRFVAELRDSSELARLFPFRFSESQAYVLALNDGYIRYIAQRGVVGAPYEIAHPWTAADLARLSYTQFNDVAYFAHRAYKPQKLARMADTNWSIAAAEFDDGPYLELNETATTLTPADYGSLTPVMTGLTTPSGTVNSSGGWADAYKIFDKDPATRYAQGVDNGWISYQLASGSAIVDSYYLQAHNDNPERMPTAWYIEASNDGSTWLTLDNRDGESGWSGGQTRFYEFSNKAAYSYYRFRWYALNGATANSMLGELGFNRAPDSQTAFDLTASSVTGINGDQGFLASDVGRMIRLLGSDGKYRWAEITARTSSTVVKIKIHGHALPDLKPVPNWRLGAWSDETGWPGCTTLYNERLVFARTDQQPANVWGSKQGGFTDFGVSDPLVDTDGINIQLLSNNMNEILWLADDEDLVTGSAGQIRSIGPSDLTQSFSATNITQKKGPTSGATYLQPLSIGGVTLYVGDGATKIRELVLGDQNRYVAPELTVLAEHMFKSGIVDWAFAEKPDPTIYVAMDGGLLVAITYDREQKVLGFARHDVGGVVENVAVIPSTVEGVDDLYMVVRRTINGETVRYIEVLEAPFDGDTTAIEDAFFVDCGLTYSGSPISTVTGLGHLEGEAVKVFADGQSINDTFTVESGQIELPSAFSKISVGLPFESRAVTMPISGPGQDGYLFGRRTKVMAAFIDVLNSGSLMVGAYGDENWTPPLYQQILQEGGGLFTAPTSLKTGYIRCDFDSSWAAGQGKIVMETDDPLPLLIRAVSLQSEYEP
jgi:hypothetical protein